MIDGKYYFDQPVKSDMRTTIIFEKLQQFKDMTTQLVVWQTIITSINTIR